MTDASLTIRFDELETLLREMEELQRKKVLDLARRLKPGLVLEDLQNPHDFPELNDTDWHYEDGVLTGIKSIQTAISRLSRESQERERESQERERESQERERESQEREPGGAQ